MADLDLRPLSLGEILDRTFSLYRRNFVLFAGIAAVPQLLVLAWSLVQTLVLGRPATPGQPQFNPSSGLVVLGILGVIVGVVVYVIAYLFAQGGTVYAVSDLYLGRTTSIGTSLSRMRGHAGNLFGVTLLNGLVVGVATLLLIIPGIYMACRLITCVPAALLENIGPRDSLERSFALTKNSAGRSFVIYLLYFVLAILLNATFVYPFTFAAVFFRNDPAMMRMWLAFSQVGTSAATVLVTPFLTIATAIFYYDLRVRKEAFDLQLMLNPGGSVAAPSSSVPTMFS